MSASAGPGSPTAEAAGSAPWARLRATHRAVAAWFGSLSPEEMLHDPGACSWRPVDDLRHLTLATEALSRALTLEGRELEERWGRAEATSRPCPEVARSARKALEGGATSPEPMIPEGAGEAPVDVRSVLDGWREAAARLEALEVRWDGAELDRYRVPHPFLGLLTLREWLCFNHVHARHHLRVAAGRLGREVAGA